MDVMLLELWKLDGVTFAEVVALNGGILLLFGSNIVSQRCTPWRIRIWANCIVPSWWSG